LRQQAAVDSWLFDFDLMALAQQQLWAKSALLAIGTTVFLHVCAKKQTCISMSVHADGCLEECFCDFGPTAWSSS
jgi:hypothetical protein